MRRRRSAVNVWPAVADLMTVLAVTGLFGLLTLDRQARRLEVESGEAARNQTMFEAIQRAQEIVDEIARDQELAFGPDQTLQFGEDLVRFDRNSVEPVWQPEGRLQLRRLCETLRDALGRRTETGLQLRRLFTVQVEGHTDASPCPGDAHCNWWISSGRAAVFVALMRQEAFCPGGADLALRPIGFADTQPLATARKEADHRRIAVQLLPSYRRIIESEER